MSMPRDLRIKQDELEKILEYILERYYGRSLTNDFTAEQKREAIATLANQIMESRNGAPISRDELTRDFMAKLTIELEMVLCINKNKTILTAEEREFIKKYDALGYQPTPEEKLRYENIQKRFERNLQKTNEDLLTLLLTTKMLPSPKPTKKPDDPELSIEEKEFIQRHAQQLTAEMLTKQRSWTNLTGLMTRETGSLAAVVPHFLGSSYFLWLGPISENSTSFVSSYVKTSDTVFGDPLGFNHAALAREEQIGALLETDNVIQHHLRPSLQR